MKNVGSERVRNPSETFAQLLGHSGRAANAVVGPSSASMTSTHRPEHNASSDAAATLRPDLISSRTSSSRSTSKSTLVFDRTFAESIFQVPAHRQPALFQPVTPPKPLPPKKVKNPFAPKQKANEERR